MEEMLPIMGVSWQESISLAQDTCKHLLCGLATPTLQAGVPEVQSHLTCADPWAGTLTGLNSPFSANSYNH